MKTNTSPLLFIVVFYCFLLSGANLCAAPTSYYWDGGGVPVSGNYLLSDGANWEGEVAPPSGAGHFLNIRGASGLSILVDSGFSAGNLYFRLNGTVASSSFSISGQPLTLALTNAVANQSGAFQTINNDMVLTYSGEASVAAQGNSSLGLPASLTVSNITVSGSLYLRADYISVVTANGVIGGTSGSSVAVRTGGDSSGKIYLNSGSNRISSITVGRGGTYLGADNAAGAGSAMYLSGSDTYLFLQGYDQRVTSLTNSAHTPGTQRISNTLSGSENLSTLTYDRSTSDETFTSQLASATGNGNFAFVKEGTNTFVLAPTHSSGANFYTGGTQVNAGTLLISSDATTNSVTGNGAVTVAAGATFGGKGRSMGAVTVEGMLRAGLGEDATGTLTLTSNLTLADNSIIEIALGDSGTHSALARAGGTWTFSSDQAFTFLDFGATPGSYSGIISGLASLVDTTTWTITNDGWNGSFVYNAGSIDLVLTAVPEPSSVALLGLAGALGLLVRMKRSIAF